jgi:hypothetical protein
MKVLIEIVLSALFAIVMIIAAIAAWLALAVYLLLFSAANFVTKLFEGKCR